MQNWIDSEFFGFWKEAQTRISKSLSAKPDVNDLQGLPFIWQKPGINQMCQWGESAVRQSLELQAGWIEQWLGRYNNDSVSLASFAEAVGQINEAMDRWSRMQAELWSFWFDMLDNTAGKFTELDPNRVKIETWKTVVYESRSELTHWFTKWEEQINCKPLVPDELNRLVEKLGQEMLGWIQNQAVLWQYGFDFFKTSPPIPSDPVQEVSDTESSGEYRDDLTRISGIGPVIEQLLNQNDIVSYGQIANLSEAEIKHLEKNVIRFPAQIHGKQWVRQAKELCDSGVSSG